MTLLCALPNLPDAIDDSDDTRLSSDGLGGPGLEEVLLATGVVADRVGVAGATTGGNTAAASLDRHAAAAVV